MKKVLRITGMILLCLLIGYGIGLGISHFMGDGADGEGVDKMKMAKARVMRLMQRFLLTTTLQMVTTRH